MRIKLLLPAILLVLISACKKVEPTSEKEVVFSIDCSETQMPVVLVNGATKNLTLATSIAEPASKTMEILFTVDSKLVETFNQEHGTQYSMLPATAYFLFNQAVSIQTNETTSSTCPLTLMATGLQDNAVYILPVTIGQVENADKFKVIEPLYVLVEQFTPEKGNGTKEKPYSLVSADDIKNLKSKLKHGEKVYFKVWSDIDMKGIDYTPFNNLTPWDYLVDINGQNFTISNLTSSNKDYASFAGIVYGDIYNLNFKDPVIIGNTTTSCGVLGGYVGDTGRPAHAYGIKVTGASIYTSADNCGGIAGSAVETTIENCSFEGVFEAPGKRRVGGIAGNVTTDVVIKNCWSKGFGRSNREIGGIAGILTSKDSKIISCYSEVDLYAQFSMGGICGHANLNSATYGQKPNNEISNCIAWNSSLSSYTSDTGAHYSIGAVVGFTSPWNTLKDCFRRDDMYFLESPGNREANTLIDQPNADKDNPLVTGTSEGRSGEYIYPYHGKAAQTKTAAQIAKDLGWDETIWNLSGNIPVLR